MGYAGSLGGGGAGRMKRFSGSSMTWGSEGNSVSVEEDQEGEEMLDGTGSNEMGTRAESRNGPGTTLSPQMADSPRLGGLGMFTARARRRTPPHQEIHSNNPPIAPFGSPMLRSSQSTPYMNTLPGSASPSVSSQDRFTSFPIRSPRPPSRDSWHGYQEASYSSSEEDERSSRHYASPALVKSRFRNGHFRTGSEVVTPRKLHRPPPTYNLMMNAAEESSRGNGIHQPAPRLANTTARPVSMHDYGSTAMALANAPYPRPKSSQDFRPAVEASAEAGRIPLPTRPTHGLRQLRLSQSSITGITGLPFAQPISRSSIPGDRSPITSEHGFAGSPIKPIPGSDKKRKRASLQDVTYRRPLSLHAMSPELRRRSQTTDEDLVEGDEREIALINNETGLPGISLQRSHSIPPPRNGHLMSSSLSQGAEHHLPATFPLNQKPFIGGNDGLSLPSAFLQTPVRPRTQRTVSLGPLTLSSLKAAFLALHLRRRKMACCLLALRFDQGDVRFLQENRSGAKGLDASIDQVALAQYWAGLDDLLDRMLTSFATSKEVVRLALPEEVPMIGRNLFGLSSVTHRGHAPRHTDAFLLNERAEAVLMTLERLQLGMSRFDAANKDPADLEKEWDGFRQDLAGMIRDWEGGRNVIAGMLAGQVPIDTVSADSVDQSDAPPRGDASVKEKESPAPSDRLNASEDPEVQVLQVPGEGDDASNHLIQSTSPAFLPPPGIEAVFEGLSSRGASSLPIGSKLSREERIQAVKAQRAAKSPLQDSFAQTTVGNGTSADPLNRTDGNVRIRGGEMVNELKGVIGELRRRKEAGGTKVTVDGQSFDR